MSGSFKRKANWFLALVIGAWCEGIGLALRLGVRQNLLERDLHCSVPLRGSLGESSIPFFPRIPD